MDRKLVVMQKEAVVANCKIPLLPRNVPGWTEEYYKKSVRVVGFRNNNRSQVVPNTELTW
jgi:hypothetical protein